MDPVERILSRQGLQSTCPHPNASMSLFTVNSSQIGHADMIHNETPSASYDNRSVICHYTMSMRLENGRKAKDVLIDLMKENKTYDELYVSNNITLNMKENTKRAVERTVMGRSTENRRQILKNYSTIGNNEIATGFIIDFLRSLGLSRSLQCVESEWGVDVVYLIDLRT